MDTTAHGLGRLPLPRDDRDWPASRVLAATARTARIRRFWSMGGAEMRIDQGGESTCTSHAWTNFLIDGPIVHPDKLAFQDVERAHKFARRLYLDATGDDTYSRGSSTRQVVAVLVKRGLVAAYYLVSTVDEALDVLLNVGPICIATGWYRSMEVPYAAYGNAYIRFDESTGARGGHAYALTGVDLAPVEGPPYVRMQNSWGPDWGQNGTARIPLPDLHGLWVNDCFIATEAVF